MSTSVGSQSRALLAARLRLRELWSFQHLSRGGRSKYLAFGSTSTSVQATPPRVRLSVSAGCASGPRLHGAFLGTDLERCGGGEREACRSSTGPTPDFQEAPEKLSS